MNAFPDTYQEAIAAMLDDGLIAEKLILDGNWHRCQVDNGERNQDGSYKVLNSVNPVVFWSNWSRGVSGYWCAKARSRMTREERREFEAEIARLREEDRQKLEAAQAEAARVANAIWKEAKPAPEDHGYLKRKEVKPGPCRLLTKDMTELSNFAKAGNLVLPLIDAGGEIVSLEFILPKRPENGTDKLFLTDGKKKGSYYPISAKPGLEEEPLLIAEGFATAMSLHMATGLEVWIALDCHNLLEVAKLARSMHPARKIGICADYDEPLLPNYPNRGGIGAEKGRKAAEAIGGYYALCPLFEGRDKADFNDLACELGLARVQSEIEAALNGRPVTDCPMPQGFYMVEQGAKAGLYYTQTKPDGTSEDVRLGPPLKVLAYTRTGEGDNWGLMLRWNDPDGRQHDWPMPLSLLNNQKAEWFATLIDGGWLGNPAYRKHTSNFLSSVRPIRNIRCVTATGWHKGRYVLPDASFGDGEDQLVLQSFQHDGLYQTAGSLAGWQELAGLSVGNPKLGFALSCAFTGPLLELAGVEGGLFSFEGGSSCGKTTALIAAASVWGKPEFHVKSWWATDNSLEVTASLHNDGLLVLDELGQARTKTLGESVYMLSGGMGKARAARDGGLRKSYRWRVLVLSSGELGLADKLMEEGKRARAGQEVRFVAIPVTTEDTPNLYGMENLAVFLRHIRNLADTHYGVAGRAFLERLTQGGTLQAARIKLQEELEDIADSFCPKGCDGQVRRVALRFALVSIAGELAREMGILPADFEAADYARACFNEWLEQRGGTGPAEEMAILNQVRLFIEQHGNSRFMPVDNPDAYCPNSAGFREEDTKEGGYVFYCWPEVFRAEIIKGHSQKRAVEVLVKAGWLKLDGGRSTRQKKIRGRGNKRYYVIQMPEELEE